jgi:hypothetical protein
MKHPATARALVRLALVAAAGIAAATVWAQNRPEQGLLLDAQSWNDEVLTAAADPWPQDGWYRLDAGAQGIDVRAVRPGESAGSTGDALFFRLPGTALQQGVRESAAGRFSLRVDEVDAGVQVAIGYGGRSYHYVVGPRGASPSVRAVADLDGDGHPDFVIDAGDSTLLLLSTQAQPGLNLPTAELPAHGGC